jgi:hypothetical protein
MGSMSARRGSIASFLIKWLVIPVGLAAIGFFVVGPRLGRTNEAPPPPQPVQAEPAPDPDSGQANPKFKGEPEVEVSSRPVEQHKPVRRKHRNTQPPPTGIGPDVPGANEAPGRGIG